MIMRLYRDWPAHDGSGSQAREVTIPAGEHEVEEIPNPYGYAGTWLVLKGTKIGGARVAWEQWGTSPDSAENDWGIYRVEIIE